MARFDSIDTTRWPIGTRFRLKKEVLRGGVEVRAAGEIFEVRETSRQVTIGPCELLLYPCGGGDGAWIMLSNLEQITNIPTSANSSTLSAPGVTVDEVLLSQAQSGYASARQVHEISHGLIEEQRAAAAEAAESGSYINFMGAEKTSEKKPTRRDRAIKLISTSTATVQEREGSYGAPEHDMARIAQMWSAILGIEVKPEQVPLCMIAVKLSRASNAYKDDNMIDVVGYAQVYEEVMNYKRDGESEHGA